MALILALGVAYLQHQDKLSQRQTIAAHPLVFPGITAGNLEWISVSGLRGKYSVAAVPEDLRQASRGARWVLVKPKGARTDQAVVSEIVDKILNLRVRNTIEIGSASNDPVTLGFLPPDVTLSLKYAEQEKQLELGKRHSFSGRRYARFRGGEQVMLIDEALFSTIDKSVSEVRDKMPVEFDAAQVRQVALERREQGRLQFVRDTQDNWWVVQAEQSMPTDKEIVNRLLKRLASLKVERFVDQQRKLDAYGIEEPFLVALLGFDDSVAAEEQVTSLVIGAVEQVESILLPEGERRQDYYLMVGEEPWLYKLKQAAFLEFLQPLLHYRSKAPLKNLKLDDLRKVEIHDQATARTQSFDLSGKKANGDLSKWLERLQAFRVLAYLEDDAEIGEIGFSIKLWGEDEKKPVGVLQFGAALRGEEISDAAPRRAALIFGEELFFVVSSAEQQELRDGIMRRVTSKERDS